MGWIWMQAATLLLNHSQIRNAYSQFILAHIRLCTGIFSILQKQTFRIDIDIVRYTYIENIDAAAKSPQSCQTLCDPIDGTPPGSPRPWDFTLLNPVWESTRPQETRMARMQGISLWERHRHLVSTTPGESGMFRNGSIKEIHSRSGLSHNIFMHLSQVTLANKQKKKCLHSLKGISVFQLLRLQALF